jgi:hypothetical protein
VTIQNKSSVLNSCTWNYTYSAESLVNENQTVTYQIPANSSVQHNHRVDGLGVGLGQHNLPNGWVGSLVVTCNQVADGIAQLTYYTIESGDTFMAHVAATTP